MAKLDINISVTLLSSLFPLCFIFTAVSAQTATITAEYPNFPFALLTNLGPSPTAFRPGPGCFSATAESLPATSITFGCGQGEHASCCPPGGSQVGYFSPGALPQGYTLVDVGTSIGITMREQSALIACPSIFYSTFSITASARVGLNTNLIHNHRFIECVYSTVPPTSQATSNPNHQPLEIPPAPAIVYFPNQPVATALFQNTPNINNSTNGNSTITGNMPRPTEEDDEAGSTPIPTGQGKGSTLGPGAIAGIAVGVAVPVIAGAILLVVFRRRRGSKRGGGGGDSAFAASGIDDAVGNTGPQRTPGLNDAVGSSAYELSAR